MSCPIITLTTDFGAADTYVGVMKGVILSINPQANIVDLGHEVSPQAILQAAFLISMSHRYFPRGTIHVIVVDPGVGTSRRAVLLLTPSASFLAPDNGVLSYILKAGLGRKDPLVVDNSYVYLPAGYKAYSLTNPRFWLHPVSSTFHGRDIFAPVAAHLSLGVEPHQLGEEIDKLRWLPVETPNWVEGTITGRVVYIDRFGNLITNISADRLAEAGSIDIEVKGQHIGGLSPSYAEGGWLLSIIGSHGNLEISVKNGSAAHELMAKVGDPVKLFCHPR